MTLTTTILVADPVDPEKVHAMCNDLLGALPTVRVRRVRKGEPFWPSGHVIADKHEIGNEVGQGLPALMWVNYADDGPIQHWTAEEIADYETLETPPFNDHCVSVKLDTAYGYKAPNGAHCDHLHAWLITQIGAWLDDRRLRWCWNTDILAEWYIGAEGIEALADPARGALR